MSIHASVTLTQGGFVAALSDGRRVDRPDFREMAEALHRAGVGAEAVSFAWDAGQRMLTAGQQVALRAELRRLDTDPALLLKRA
jgi:hypothetical protein